MELLEPHPDSRFYQYIIDGISQGFCIGFDCQSHLCPAKHNLLSCREHPEVVSKYIQAEIGKGRLVGPLVKSDFNSIHCSPFGVIPKKGADAWRLIVDLSSPTGGSVNDGIRDDWASLHYVSVDLELGQGTLMAKCDIKSAFRIIPVHPTDKPLLGMEWNDSLYVDSVLPFGLRSAPKLFNAVADAIQFIATGKGVNHVTHYLDDFLLLGQAGSGECSQALATFKLVCSDLHGCAPCGGKVSGTQLRSRVPGHNYRRRKDAT